MVIYAGGQLLGELRRSSAMLESIGNNPPAEAEAHYFRKCIEYPDSSLIAVFVALSMGRPAGRELLRNGLDASSSRRGAAT